MDGEWKREYHGPLLRELRQARDFSQARVAESIGVAQPTIGNWERGNSDPSPDQFEALDSLFGTTCLQDADESVGQITSETTVLADWVRTRREAKGWSRKDLAEQARVSYPTILNIETGRSTNPQVRTREAIEAALEESIPDDIEHELESEASVGAEGVGALVDFDPYDLDGLPVVPGIYVFYDVSDRPIYIGKASRIASRVRDHEQKFWYKRPIVDKAAYIQIDDATLRTQIERVMIRFLKSNAVINKQLVDRTDNDDD